MEFPLKKSVEIEYSSISLDLKVKGDKFLYYKRRLEMLEKTIQIFPFWNNSYIWLFISFSLSTIYFLLFLLDKYLIHFQEPVSILIFGNISTIGNRYTMYFFFFLIPLSTFLISLYIGYKLYNRNRIIAYTLISTNTVSTILFLISLIKIVQMHTITLL